MPTVVLVRRRWFASRRRDDTDIDRLSIVAISSSDDGKDEGEKLSDIPLVLCCKSWGLSSSYACHEPSSYAWHRVISFDIERFSGCNS
ncbi:hypothetical protein QYF36_020730 [Acer negundo]|nr:hypothetical protein QYF36_020730 [Acer negundo]